MRGISRRQTVGTISADVIESLNKRTKRLMGVGKRTGLALKSFEML